MATTKAFDTALFVGVPANVQDGVVVTALGPPFTAAFAPLVVGSAPGVTVGASMPKATAQNQILISGSSPNFAWGLGTNPGVAAAVPPPTTQYQLLMADAVPSWQVTDITTVLARGGAVTIASGGTFTNAANLVFTPSGTVQKRIDGGDPAFSQLDNFLLDSGTF